MIPGASFASRISSTSSDRRAARHGWFPTGPSTEALLPRMSQRPRPLVTTQHGTDTTLTPNCGAAMLKQSA